MRLILFLFELKYENDKRSIWASSRTMTSYILVDGNWGQWGPLSKCNQTCGYGYQHRRRKCDDPKNQYTGDKCPGISLHVVPGCNAFPCPGKFNNLCPICLMRTNATRMKDGK